MKRILAAVLTVLCLLSALSCERPVTECSNPLTYTDTPDPDVIRVGDDFYLVTTTMYFCPMVPIMHSRDLVHWEIVSYVTPDIGDIDNYTFAGGKNAYGKGQWATSLKYHDGWYYVLFITNETRKTYIYRTQDITRSNWDLYSVLDEPFHDATLHFDEDGRVFVVYGNSQLRLVELEPDLSGVRQGGVNKLIVDYHPEGAALGAEGTRFLQIGDYYYLLEIDSAREWLRTERCWRSKSIEGPYEQKVVCKGTIGGRSDGVAQGTIVDTPAGDWYAVVFQDHGAVGRIITLQPVTWVDGWPIMGDDTKPVESLTVNLAPWGGDKVWASDEFDGSELPLVWQWNHKPLDGCWSLSERPGWLRLTTGQLADNLGNARNSLTQRTVGPKCHSVVKMDATGLKKGDFAGISAFQSTRVSIGIEAGESGRELVVRTRRTERVPGEPAPAEIFEDILRQPAESDIVWLRIDYDFDNDTATVSYSYDGEAWTGVDYVLQMRYTLDYFTGYRTALFCYATEELGGHADFDFFHQEIDKN